VADWEVSRTEVSTVLKVDWSLVADGMAWVEFGEGECNRSTPPQEGNSGEVLLLGLGANSEICIRVMAEIDGAERASEERTMVTGSVVGAVPEFHISEYDPDRVEPGYLLGSTVNSPGARFVMDRVGKVLWSQAVDLDYISPQVEVALDGSRFLANEFWKNRGEDRGLIRDVTLEGGNTWSERTVMAHHVFEQLPDGTVAYLVIDVRETEEFGPVVGDAIIELAPDGTEREVWNIWDHVERFPQQSPFGWNMGFYPQGKYWSHGNSLRYHSGLDSYTVSFRNLDTVLEIDRTTGEILRSLGAYGEIDVPSNIMGAPHGAYWTSPTTVLFLTSPRGTGESRAVELSVDAASGTFEVLWSWGEGQGLLAIFLGLAVRLEGGNTFVNFGSMGALVEVSPEGDVVWRADPNPGVFPGHMSLFSDWYDLAG
jgi:hypothetical protein